MDNKIEIIEEYKDIDLNSVSFSMKCPAVVKLTTYKHYKNRNKVKFSRYNIFYRDQFKCQYCGKHKKNPEELTFDHVIPRSAGGKTEWTNIVTACLPCNSKKGNKLLHETSMELLSIPKEPKVTEIKKFGSLYYNMPPIWENYL
jgi:5-methylcytosine-specific restriction endonuclease McrA